MKKILITGATGSIGRKLCTELLARGDEITAFTRNVKAPLNPHQGGKSESIRFVDWDYRKPDKWMNELNGKNAVIHLAGSNLGSKRWNEKFKREAYESRIISTGNLVEAIKKVEQKPRVFICASGIGIYGERYDEVLDEESSLGNDFLSKLCEDWEKEAAKVEHYDVRRVSIRTGIGLMKDEGALKKMLLPFKFFVGGSLSTGKQWFPWIHIDDIVGIYLHAINNQNLNGVVNAVSPGIVRMKEFAKTLGKVLKRTSFFPVPKIIMKIAAGEVAEYAVMSQRTSVDKIINAGYKFKFEILEEALRNLLK